MVVAIENHQIGYLPVPKAACTSVKAALFDVSNAYGRRKRRAVREDSDRVHRLMPTLRFRDYRFAEYDGWFRFTVVRDPIKRLIACYTDRVVKRNDIDNSKSVLRGQVTLNETPDPDYFFQNLDMYSQWVSVIRHHALRQRAFIGADLTVYDRVYTTADIPALSRDLSDRVGQDIVVPRFNTSSSASLSFDDLAPKSRDAIFRRTRADYRLLSDHFSPPWG